MTNEDMVKFIEENLRELADSESSTEESVRKAVGPWMAAFRASQFHRQVVTGYYDLMEEAIRMDAPRSIAGRVPTTMALVYFVLGMRAAEKMR